ncbi:inositol monophosphatase family protein [bacterium]|nr:inositol monophosphatase family protein [bacterium]
MTEEIHHIVRGVRDILMPQYGNVKEVRSKDGVPWNVVTDLDVAVEMYLRDNLAKIDSSIAFAGEELGGSREHKRFWLVDPIDGTQHYIRGLPFCTTMLALIEDGQVILSVVYDFVNDILYSAEKGVGSFMNGKRIFVSGRPSAEAYVAWETHLDREPNKKLFDVLNRRFTMIKTVSAGFEYAAIATGKIEARICFDPYGKDYDFAPGSLLVSEAGGMVANLGLQSYDFRNVNFIAANPVVFRELTEGENALFPI